MEFLVTQLNQPSIRLPITKTRMVKIMLEELLQRFLAENGTWYYELKAAIMNCKQKGISMATYFSKLKKLCDELTNYYERLSVCDCEKTTTELVKTTRKGKSFCSFYSVWTLQFLAQSVQTHSWRGPIAKRELGTL